MRDEQVALAWQQPVERRTKRLGFFELDHPFVCRDRVAGIEKAMLVALARVGPPPMRRNEIASGDDRIRANRAPVEATRRGEHSRKSLLHDVVDQHRVSDAAHNNPADQRTQLNDVVGQGVAVRITIDSHARCSDHSRESLLALRSTATPSTPFERSWYARVMTGPLLHSTEETRTMPHG